MLNLKKEKDNFILFKKDKIICIDYLIRIDDFKILSKLNQEYITFYFIGFVYKNITDFNISVEKCKIEGFSLQDMILKVKSIFDKIVIYEKDDNNCNKMISSILNIMAKRNYCFEKAIINYCKEKELSIDDTLLDFKIHFLKYSMNLSNLYKNQRNKSCIGY